jgi:hypothetical protein
VLEKEGRLRFLALAAAMAIALPAAAIDMYVNGAPYRKFSPQELSSISYPVPNSSGSKTKGVSLGFRSTRIGDRV